jgi:hypothetical protein
MSVPPLYETHLTMHAPRSHFVRARYDSEIAEVLTENIASFSASELAAELVKTALPLMQQKDISSPFSSRATDEGTDCACALG